MLAPSAGVLSGAGSPAGKVGCRLAVRVSSRLGLRQSAFLTATSWEAGGSPARPWGGPEALSGLAVPGSDKRTVSHWVRESCQHPWKDQVVGV